MSIKALVIAAVVVLGMTVSVFATANPDGTNKKIVSLADGRLSLDGTTAGILGLDAGQYWLVETKAPDGYIRQQEPIEGSGEIPILLHI